LSDTQEIVRTLEQRLFRLKSTLAYAHRAFVIEFAGTPKSGKSTAVEAIRHFFTRNGFRVHVLAERAAVCPIPMKGHLFFNTWCACSMLAELLANVEAEADIIIVDRGIFDSLVWLTLQLQRGEITNAEAAIIDSFLLLERWRTLTDLIAVMNVPANEALARENAQRITTKTGSIMNEQVLGVLSDSVHTAYEKYKHKFEGIILHDTSGSNVRESNTELASKILDSLEPFLNPEILVVPKEFLEALPMDQGGYFSKEAIEAAVECITSHGKFVRRSDAESDDNLVQIIPAGILAYLDKVFIFQRKEADSKYRLYGKTTVLEATHTVKNGDLAGIKLLEDALFARVARSLFLGRRFPMELIGYCWDSGDKNSRRHFAMVFQVSIDSEHTAEDLKKKEFRRWRGPSRAGEFLSWGELKEKAEELNLEPWSLAILRSKVQ
jgi:predicted NUDIX family phosphoesterase/thymidylate kinase